MMANETIKVLGLPGSLRPDSSALFVMKYTQSLLPSSLQFTLYDGVGKIPHFDDQQYDHPELVRFRQLISESDAVLICTPEYAFGVPGSLKNALDWTVATGDFDGKLTALVTASSQGEKGHAAMLQILRAINARVPAKAHVLISFIRAKLDHNGTLTDENSRKAIQEMINSIFSAKDHNQEDWEDAEG